MECGGLDRVCVRIIDPADDFEVGRLHLEGLALGRRGHDHAGGLHRAAGSQVRDLAGVVRQRARRRPLSWLQAVREVDERNAGLRVSAGTDPALDGDRLIGRRLAAEDLLDAQCGHVLVALVEKPGGFGWKPRVIGAV